MQGYIGSVIGKICPSCEGADQAGMNFFYFVVRVLVGFMFMQHGIQKLFGGFGGVDGNGGTVQMLTLFGAAGVIEFFGGLAIALGFLTRLFASIAAVEMLVAYFQVHQPQALYPIENQGELALMYFSVFLLISIIGAGMWSLERAMVKREIF